MDILPGVFDTLDILNLHHIIRESNIFKDMSGHRLQWKAEDLSAVAHLAHARSQNSRTGILGIY